MILKLFFSARVCGHVQSSEEVVQPMELELQVSVNFPLWEPKVSNKTKIDFKLFQNSFLI